MYLCGFTVPGMTFNCPSRSFAPELARCGNAACMRFLWSPRRVASRLRAAEDLAPGEALIHSCGPAVPGMTLNCPSCMPMSRAGRTALPTLKRTDARTPQNLRGLWGIPRRHGQQASLRRFGCLCMAFAGRTYVCEKNVLRPDLAFAVPNGGIIELLH